MENEMVSLKVVAVITSDETNDPDDVPTYDNGNCRSWGAWSDSPLPDTRVFMVFSREPVSEEEAYQVAKAYFGEDED